MILLGRVIETLKNSGHEKTSRPSLVSTLPYCFIIKQQTIDFFCWEDVCCIKHYSKEYVREIIFWMLILYVSKLNQIL